MSRRLNPEIFSPSDSHSPGPEESFSALANRKLERDMKDTKKRVSQLESLVEVLQSQITSMNHNMERRQDAISKALHQIELEMNQKNREADQHRERLRDHFRDQQVKDTQVEAIIDRFNSNLTQFENKISVLRKLISEKDQNMISFRKVMEQIVDEVESLKNR